MMQQMHEPLLREVSTRSIDKKGGNTKVSPTPTATLVKSSKPVEHVVVELSGQLEDTKVEPHKVEPTMHKVSFWLNLVAICAVGFAVVDAFFVDLVPVSVVVPVAGCVYFVYLYEALCFCCGFSRTLLLLRDLDMYKTPLSSVLQSMRATRPVVTMHVDCFHLVCLSPEIGPIKKRESQIETKRVVSWSQSAELRFDEWDDISEEIVLPKKGFCIVRLNLSKQLVYADADTQTACEAQRSEFQNLNRWRDDRMAFSERVFIRNFQPFVWCFGDSDAKVPFLLRSTVFYTLATLCLLSWPFRIWTNQFIVGANYSVCKRIKSKAQIVQ